MRSLLIAKALIAGLVSFSFAPAVLAEERGVTDVGTLDKEFRRKGVSSQASLFPLRWTQFPDTPALR